jgi:nucleotide-binding universal stress UspA family protein
MSEIVVGVDGSAGSAEVLGWAAAEAVLRKVTLRAVCVTQSPSTWVGMGDAMGSGISMTIADSDLEAYGMATIDELLESVELPAGLDLVKDVQVGHPADVLVGLSSAAELLVVGSGGHGDIGSVLLGSVGMHCVHHAACPVVVVPTKHSR